MNERGQKKRKRSNTMQKKTADDLQVREEREARQLDNGKWACNHHCNDKTKCKHLCCRDGVDKKPKPPKARKSSENKSKPEPDSGSKQTQLILSVNKKVSGTKDVVASNNAKMMSSARQPKKSKEASDLDRLHNSIKTNTPAIGSIGQSQQHARALCSSPKNSDPPFSFLDAVRGIDDEPSDYGNGNWCSEDLLGTNDLERNTTKSRACTARDENDVKDLEDEMLDVVEAGNVTSQHSEPFCEGLGDGHVDMSFYSDDPNAFNEVPSGTNDPFEDKMFDMQPEVVSQPNKSSGMHSTNDHSNIFVGGTSDSAAQHLGMHSTGEEPHGFAEEDYRSTTNPSSPAKKHDRATQVPWAQLRVETERLECALTADAFLADGEEMTATAQEALGESNTTTSDEMKAWFESEFGTELFNYTGA